MMTPQQINQSLATDSIYQSLLKSVQAIYAKGGPAKNPMAAGQKQQLDDYVTSKYGLPAGYTVEPSSGQVVETAPFDTKRFLLALSPLAVGAGAAALGFGAGSGVLGGGASTAAATTAAAAGTTGSGVLAAGLPAGSLATGVPAATGAAAAIAGGGGAAGAGGAVANYLGGSVLDWTKLGLGGVGSYLSGKSADQQSQLKALVDLMNTQVGREDTQRSSIANYLANTQANQEADQRARSATSLNSTQMDPYAQAKALNGANVRRSFAEGLGGSTSSMIDPKGIDMSALSPESLQKNADYFYKNAADANPDVPVGAQSQSAEQFRLATQAAYKAKQQQMQDMIMKYLQQIGSPVVNQPTLPQV